MVKSLKEADEQVNSRGSGVLIRLGYEEVEVWPGRCLNRNRSCLQCWLNGKLSCAPRPENELRK